ncbi:MAG: rod shape-determining protein MreD [Dethiobacter sp.]|jgi:rod shape-determining protein MreD|nr:rod shape-determining protein MreD [Dethiobacter sp.]
MGIIFIFGLFVISLVIQGSVLALAGTGGVHPDILFVVVVALALLSDGKRGALLGFSAGMLQDIVFASPIGFFTFGKMLAGLLAGLLAHEIYRDFVPVPVIVVTVLTVLNEAVTYLLMNMYFNPQVTFIHYLQHFSLPRVAMHILVMAIAYPYLYTAQKRRMFFHEPESTG